LSVALPALNTRMAIATPRPVERVQSTGRTLLPPADLRIDVRQRR
jgi:hypothetical protein